MLKEDLSPTECDVLVVGAGMAGCWAAIRASQMGARVILVDRAKVSRNGKSSFSGAGIICPEPGDDLDLWQKEIVESGRYLADQDWVRVLLEEIRPRLDEMEELGIPIERDGQGKIKRFAGMGSHLSLFANIPSLPMMEVLKKRLVALEVDIRERTMITELLTSDGQLPTRGAVCGAVGFDVHTGEARVFSARAVVLSSGGTGYADLTGDGVAQAFRVGAEAHGFEFSRSCSVGLARKFPAFHLLTFQRLGMILRNARGGRFMERYQPILKEAVTRQGMIPAIVTEGLEGRGPIYLDMTHLSPQALDTLRTSHATAAVVDSLEKDGYDLGKDLVEVHVSSGPVNVVCGGIRNNTFAETNVPGLYAAGETGGYPAHGSYSIGIINVGQCCVGGHRAGESSARFAREYPGTGPRQEQIEALIEESRRPLYRRHGRSANSLIRQINSDLSPGDISAFKSERTLSRALLKVDEWEGESDSLFAGDWHELVLADKVKNYLLNVKLVFKASLTRQESRGSHVRLDRPYEDNQDWLKWLVMRADSGEISERLVPVPVYRYPVRPEKYERVPISSPLPSITE